MKIIEDDFVKMIVDGETEGLFVHQVNCKRVAGAGLAGTLRDRVPGWYEHYKQEYGLLGSYRGFKIKSGLWIIDLYGQDGYGREQRHTDYWAIGNGLKVLKAQLDRNKSTKTVYFPMGMGCGLGGGYWSIVARIIEDTIGDRAVIVWKK